MTTTLKTFSDYSGYMLANPVTLEPVVNTVYHTAAAALDAQKSWRAEAIERLDRMIGPSDFAGAEIDRSPNPWWVQNDRGDG